jgi:hypothetical protein
VTNATQAVFATGRNAAFFHDRREDMEWLGWAVVIAAVVSLCAYRYYAGKWPLKLDL